MNKNKVMNILSRPKSMKLPTEKHTNYHGAATIHIQTLRNSATLYS